MRFRPCIDIHNGKVKQIVGGSLRDEANHAKENFASKQRAGYFAKMYKRDGLSGGHVILLNPPSSEYYQETLKQAEEALAEYPEGLQVGGGIRTDNAEKFLDMGASHVIVTSYVFQDGKIRWENLEQLKNVVGKERLVVDLSCRKRAGDYYIVTDRWQKFTEVKLSWKVFCQMGEYCDEFLVHGVDVEGKAVGVDEQLVQILGQYSEKTVTYAGGIGSIDDLRRFEELTGGKIDFTIGSALDIFGGNLPYNMIKCYT